MAQHQQNLSAFTAHTVTAADGTTIGYRQTGSGPGLLLVHGALQSSLNFTKLAEALSAHFTVYVVERRGRGLSGPYQDGDNLLTEARDVLTIAAHTGTTAIFGLSSGAVITLQAALLESGINKIALYEPPIPLDPDTFLKLDKDYEPAIRNGNLGKAFIAILKGTGDDSFFTQLPAWLTAPLFNRLIKAEHQKKQAGQVTLQEVVTLFKQDRIIIRDSPPLLAQAGQLKAGVLLMDGEKSQLFLKEPVDLLGITLPAASRATFKNQGHLAADNSGDPVAVADALRDFLK